MCDGRSLYVVQGKERHKQVLLIVSCWEYPCAIALDSSLAPADIFESSEVSTRKTLKKEQVNHQAGRETSEFSKLFAGA